MHVSGCKVKKKKNPCSFLTHNIASDQTGRHGTESTRPITITASVESTRPVTITALVFFLYVFLLLQQQQQHTHTHTHKLLIVEFDGLYTLAKFVMFFEAEVENRNV